MSGWPMGAGDGKAVPKCRFYVLEETCDGHRACKIPRPKETAKESVNRPLSRSDAPYHIPSAPQGWRVLKAGSQKNQHTTAFLSGENSCISDFSVMTSNVVVFTSSSSNSRR